MRKKTINSLRKYFGSKNRRRARFRDLRYVSRDPLECYFYAKDHSILMDLPLSKGRIGAGVIFGFPAVGEPAHPFTLAAQNFVKTGCAKSIYETLERMTRGIKITGTNEALGLDERDNVFLDSDHPYSCVKPWESISKNEQMSQRRL